jgi:multidrug efflux pump subunit AcrA (membrane-fusion protein)
MNDRQIFQKHLAQTSPFPLSLEITGSEGIYLIDKDGKKYAKQVNIKTGAVSGENIEVIDGLKVGDELITTGYQSINDGNLLKVSSK